MRAKDRTIKDRTAKDHTAEDDTLVERLRKGDEAVFAELVRDWSPVMLRVARGHLSTDASSEEVVQEAWLAVVRGLDRFEGRSSLRTWVFRILTNLATTRAVREARATPVAGWDPAVGGADGGAERWAQGWADRAAAVDPSRFRGPDDAYPRHWTPVGAPVPWPRGPEQEALAAETRRLLADALRRLPPRQQTVVSLRDVHGLTADEVCAALDLSPGNERVLLHRGRARLRAALESYYRPAPEATA